MQVGVVGINHKLADLKLREQLAKSCHTYFGTLSSCHERHHFILLSTCNRTEVYFSSPDLAASHLYLLHILRTEVESPFEQKLYSYFGNDCFEHLTRVTLGLDSAILGETEIQGQVKSAYETATAQHPLPRDLHFVFQKAMGIAKRLRTEISLGRGMPNLEHAICQIGQYLFPAQQKVRLLFVGASAINQKILLFLKTKNFNQITLCNRSDEVTDSWAIFHGVERLEWSQLHRCFDYDWVIFGTKSPDYLITQQRIRIPSGNRKLVMDLCVPRNVEPSLGENNSITLFNIDQINHWLSIRRQDTNHLFAEAERRVLQAVQHHSTRYAEKTRVSSPFLAVTA